MKNQIKRPLAILLALLFAVCGCVCIAHGIRTDHRSAKVTAGLIEMNVDEYGHWDSEAGPLNEGYVNHGAKVNVGADLLAGSTFGGPFMSILIMFVPQVVVFSLLCTYIYRRTGNVYTGAVTVASMAAWSITGGSAIV